MIKEVKKFGGSIVIILDKSTRKYFGIDVGDFIDISDIVKLNQQEVKNNEKYK